MGKCILRDISVNELMKMRESGMTNQDIANTLDVGVSTIYRYIGAQPPGMRKKREYRNEFTHHQEDQREEFEEAALIVEDRRICLAGLFAGYKVNIKAKEVIVFVEDGVDALTIPFDQVETFAKELRAISKHVNSLHIGNEAW